jgi:HAD superfamily hydrolase (TIGR01509 family)
MAQLHVIFDKDGVITDNNRFHFDAWQVFFSKYDVNVPAEDFAAKVFGKTNQEILVQLFDGPLTDDQLDSWAEEKEEMFRAIYKEHFVLTNGLPSFLEELYTAKIPAAVATNAPQSNLDFTLDMGKIRHVFQVTITPKAVALPKPAPDIYIKAAELLGAQPNQCVVFEDSFTGIDAALGAGCWVIGVASTYPAEDLAKRVHHVIQDFSEIDLAWLQAWFDEKVS